MNAISDLIHTTTGMSLDDVTALLTDQHEHDDLSFQQSATATVAGAETSRAAHYHASLASGHSTHNTPGAGTVPPEIIQLIVNFLDNRDLVKVLTLNWTWAYIVASKLWQRIHFTAKDTQIVFLITHSVASLTGSGQTAGTPVGTHSTITSAPTLSAITPMASSTVRSAGVTGPHGSTSTNADTSSTDSVGATSLPNRPSKKFPETSHAPTPRRNSYPWPTLLPYHCMVHSLQVSLSSVNMVQDLLEVIPFCTELRTFSIQSTIPTEALLVRGVIAAACNDVMEPLCDTQSSSSASANQMHTSASSASLASQASSTSSSRTHSSTPGHRQHSHRHSLSMDPYNRLPVGRAGIQRPDDETIMASTTSQSGKLLSLLANSCPKLESLWMSGFHPVSVLGAPTDLRPKMPRFDVKGFHEEKQQSLNEYRQRKEREQVDWTSSVPPLAAESDTNSSSASSVTTATTSTSTTIPPAPIKGNHTPQSNIQTLQFVNCTLPPQYLLTMIQHSLPNLQSLHLTQCWQGNPLQKGFLDTLGKVSPALREITLHATQSHRSAVSSDDVFKWLRSLEEISEEEEEGSAGLMADYPLGTFSNTSYTMTTAPSISSTTSTEGSSTMSTSNLSSSSALATLSSSPLATASSDTHHGGTSTLQQSAQQLQQQRQQHELSSIPTLARSASALEAISIWFTHSVLDQAITDELANRQRHPKLRRVEFGSEDAFDAGEDFIRSLLAQRPELEVCVWVGYGDTGEDRED
ncbi:hypothetical protein BGZ98_003285 [Dissophora globulifera]|nr:hypothetical protein BGZ98_003285 [Dissophora globulifera]